MHTAKHAPPKLSYSIAETCQATGLSRSTIYNNLEPKGRLKAVRVGGRRLILAESLHALLAGEE